MSQRSPVSSSVKSAAWRKARIRAPRARCSFLKRAVVRWVWDARWGLAEAMPSTVGVSVHLQHLTCDEFCLDLTCDEQDHQILARSCTEAADEASSVGNGGDEPVRCVQPRGM